MKPKKKGSNSGRATPLVTSYLQEFRRSVTPNIIVNPEVTTKEELDGRKKKLLGILDKASDEFLLRLESGRVNMDKMEDLEKIARLVLLLSGEAETRTGKEGESLETEKSMAMRIMSKAEEILDNDDPVVIELYKKLYEGYTEINDNFDKDK